MAEGDLHTEGHMDATNTWQAATVESRLPKKHIKSLTIVKHSRRRQALLAYQFLTPH
jgi:hypothetical protein